MHVKSGKRKPKFGQNKKEGWQKIRENVNLSKMKAKLRVKIFVVYMINSKYFLTSFYKFSLTATK